MIVLGIDSGTNSTGWGVIRKAQAQEIKYIAHGCIVTEKIEAMLNRLLTLHAKLNELAKTYASDCVKVANWHLMARRQRILTTALTL